MEATAHDFSMALLPAIGWGVAWRRALSKSMCAGVCLHVQAAPAIGRLNSALITAFCRRMP